MSFETFFNCERLYWVDGVHLLECSKNLKKTSVSRQLPCINKLK